MFAWLWTMAQWAIWNLCMLPGACLLIALAILWHARRPLQCNR